MGNHDSTGAFDNLQDLLEGLVNIDDGVESGLTRDIQVESGWIHKGQELLC